MVRPYQHLLSYVLIWLGLRSLALAQQDGIDLVDPLGNGLNRFTFNCGAQRRLTFFANTTDGHPVEVKVHCGRPVYQYRLNTVGFIPLETATIEVRTCVQQAVPNVRLDRDHVPLRAPARERPKQLAQEGERRVRSGYGTQEEDIHACGALAKSEHHRHALTNVLTMNSCAAAPGTCLTPFDKIFHRDIQLVNATEVHDARSRAINTYRVTAREILSRENEAINAGLAEFRRFLQVELGQVWNKTRVRMDKAANVLQAIVSEQNEQVYRLMNETNEALLATDFVSLSSTMSNTYERSLAMMVSRMQKGYLMVRQLLEPFLELDEMNTRIQTAIEEFRATLNQLAYHQRGFSLTTGFYEALEQTRRANMTAFIGNVGRHPRLSDDFDLLIKSSSQHPDAANCNQPLHLICRKAGCAWFVRQAKEPLNCMLTLSPNEKEAITAFVDGHSYVRVKVPPTYDLEASAASSLMQSIFGPNQANWGATYADGFVTERLRNVFDRDGVYYSKCDVGRFGAYDSTWVPVYKLEFVDARVEDAFVEIYELTKEDGPHAKLRRADGPPAVIRASQTQWDDPNRRNLYKNRDLLIFHKEKLSDGSFNVYSPPSDAIQMDGPVSSRIGKLGYFYVNNVTSTMDLSPDTQFRLYRQWVDDYGAFDPKGMAVTVAQFREQTVEEASFCGDINSRVQGLCGLSQLYLIDFDPSNATLRVFPREQQITVSVDLPVQNPRFHAVTTKCPSSEIPPFRLYHSDLACQLQLRNPLPDRSLALLVSVEHLENPNCSYQFPMTLQPGRPVGAPLGLTNHTREHGLIVTLPTCPGKFAVRVFTGAKRGIRRLCFQQFANRSRLPALEETARTVKTIERQETQRIIRTYSGLLERLQLLQSKIERLKGSTEHFLLGLNETLSIHQAFRPSFKFNITEWTVVLEKMRVAPMPSVVELKHVFDASFDHKYVQQQMTTLSSIASLKHLEVLRLLDRQSQNLQKLTGLQSTMFGFLQPRDVGYLVVAILALMTLAFLSFFCRITVFPGC